MKILTLVVMAAILSGCAGPGLRVVDPGEGFSALEGRRGDQTVFRLVTDRTVEVVGARASAGVPFGSVWEGNIRVAGGDGGWESFRAGRRSMRIGGGVYSLSNGREFGVTAVDGKLAVRQFEVRLGLGGEGPAAFDREGAWCFVSFPDFFNFDVPEPFPKWDSAVGWYLDQLKGEGPRFSLVAGDLVNGHWWDSAAQIEHLGHVYYAGWMRRVRAAGLLPIYTAVGDHELGDNDWPPEKVALVPEFRRAFEANLENPMNGPEGYKERAYWVREGDVLVVTLETFEIEGEELIATVGEAQLEWLAGVFEAHRDAKFRVVQGHVPILPGSRKRSSSGIELVGAERSGLWRLMVEHDVDLYFAGEHHAITCREHEGVWQVVHGASWGRVETLNYLVGTVEGERLTVELKEIPVTLEGGAIWNVNKDPGPREVVRFTDEQRAAGFEVVGRLVIDKSGGGKRYVERSGYFSEAFAPLEH